MNDQKKCPNCDRPLSWNYLDHRWECKRCGYIHKEIQKKLK